MNFDEAADLFFAAIQATRERETWANDHEEWKRDREAWKGRLRGFSDRESEAQGAVLRMLMNLTDGARVPS